MTLPFAPEGRKPISVSAALTFLFGAITLLTGSKVTCGLLVIQALLLVLTLVFYRDPQRDAQAPSGAILSAADGVVVEIMPGHTPHTGQTAKIGVFMSPFNVHVNRIPFDGKVVWCHYHPGKKWVASAPKASDLNERFYLGLDTSAGPMAVCQIAGLLARRIVCRAKQGDAFRRGQRYGMILLGSKVDVYLPPSAIPKVKVGDKVTAGVTVIGEIPS